MIPATALLPGFRQLAAPFSVPLYARQLAWDKNCRVGLVLITISTKQEAPLTALTAESGRGLSAGASTWAGDSGGAGAVAPHADLHRVWQPHSARGAQALLL